MQNLSRYRIFYPRYRGVTLLEMLIVIAIVSIVLTVVAPNVQHILIANRLAAQTNEISAVLQFARHRAIDEQVRTTLCPTEDYAACSNNWGQAKMVFVDANDNGARDNNEVLLSSTGRSHQTLQLSGPSSPIHFQESGISASPASILICHQSREDEYARALIISLQGRVKASRDSNQDGIYEDNLGNPLDCGTS